MIKPIAIILFSILLGNISIAQSNKIHKGGIKYFSEKKSIHFELDYEEFSFFPTQQKYYPLIWVKDDSLQYEYLEKISKYTVERYDDIKYIDTIWVDDTLTKYVKFRQSSIDSITSAIKQVNPSRYLNDSLIFASNPNIIDGSIITIDLKYDDTKKVMFELGNTFDSTALQIVNIINPYLPENHKIYIPYKMWEMEMEYKKKRYNK